MSIDIDNWGHNWGHITGVITGVRGVITGVRVKLQGYKANWGQSKVKYATLAL